KTIREENIGLEENLINKKINEKYTIFKNTYTKFLSGNNIKDLEQLLDTWNLLYMDYIKEYSRNKSGQYFRFLDGTDDKKNINKYTFKSDNTILTFSECTGNIYLELQNTKQDKTIEHTRTTERAAGKKETYTIVPLMVSEPKKQYDLINEIINNLQKTKVEDFLQPQERNLVSKIEATVQKYQDPIKRQGYFIEYTLEDLKKYALSFTGKSIIPEYETSLINLIDSSIPEFTSDDKPKRRLNLFAHMRLDIDSIPQLPLNLATNEEELSKLKDPKEEAFVRTLDFANTIKDNININRKLGGGKRKRGRPRKLVISSNIDETNFFFKEEIQNDELIIKTKPIKKRKNVVKIK
ncbi:MAG: hypothetical protein EBU66_19345, partial [Bacteroidetes bacterium]|nr:hypothetical protein [Bacteroidota bacterium]